MMAAATMAPTEQRRHGQQQLRHQQHHQQQHYPQQQPPQPHPYQPPPPQQQQPPPPYPNHHGWHYRGPLPESSDDHDPHAHPPVLPPPQRPARSRPQQHSEPIDPMPSARHAAAPPPNDYRRTMPVAPTPYDPSRAPEQLPPHYYQPPPPHAQPQAQQPQQQQPRPPYEQEGGPTTVRFYESNQYDDHPPPPQDPRAAEAYYGAPRPAPGFAPYASHAFQAPPPQPQQPQYQQPQQPQQQWLPHPSNPYEGTPMAATTAYGDSRLPPVAYSPHDPPYHPPPPAPPRVVVSPSPTPSPTPSPQGADEDVPNIDDVLLDQRWTVHVISHLFYFRRTELGDYAHELVKFLRGHAIMSYQQEFGYNVNIRFTNDFVAFQVTEARDLHAEFLIERMEQPQRPGQPEVAKILDRRPEDDDDSLQQRRGGFVVYFPRTLEDKDDGRLRRPMQPSSAAPGDGASAPRDDGRSMEAKYAFLLRGNEELMVWVCSWLQRRFQCVVGKHVVRITSDNLRRLGRNWVVDILEKEIRAEEMWLRKHKSSEGIELPTQRMKAPLLLKYRSPSLDSTVQAYTLTIPWATVRRTFRSIPADQMDGLASPPEVLELVEAQHFANLSDQLGTMELIGLEMEEADVDIYGTVKFLKMSLVPSILHSLLEIFAVQEVPGPTQTVTTF